MANKLSIDLVKTALSTVIEPELGKDLISLKMIENIKIDHPNVSFTVVLTTPACPLKVQIERECVSAVRNYYPEVQMVKVNFTSRVVQDNRIMDKLDIKIKNVIAVGSGKGGVGKSTITVNLAVALALEGAKVALLDADIYGPNIPTMMGVKDLGPVKGEKLTPAENHGIKFISMGFLIPEGEAVVWRGPMLHSAVQQLITNVNWGDLDYLVVDLPPGTGDVQMSLAQSVPISGAVIVTSPQDLAVSDAKRGAAAFKKLDVPVLGLIENMSGDVFGTGGGEKAARELDVDFLGRIELDVRLREAGDNGVPLPISNPDDPVSIKLREIAKILAGKISVQKYEASMAK